MGFHLEVCDDSIRLPQCRGLPVCNTGRWRGGATGWVTRPVSTMLDSIGPATTSSLSRTGCRQGHRLPPPPGDGAMHVCRSGPQRLSAQLSVPAWRSCLFADSQLLDNGLVPLGVIFLQIVQQATTLADHHQKTSAGSVILLVRTEMFRKLPNPFAQQSDLHFGATGIRCVGLIRVDDIGLLISC